MKIIKAKQFTALKRNAQNVYPQFAKKQRLEAQIAKLSEELAETDAIIEATETGSRIITGGFNSLALLERVILDSGKVDKNGNAVKTTVYRPKEGMLQANEDGTYTVLVDVPTCGETPFGEPVYEAPMHEAFDVPEEMMEVVEGSNE